jgi:uncharacterized protein (DUF885 family)
MTRFCHVVWFGLASLGFAGCGGPAPAPAPSRTNNPAPHENLSRIVDRYWDERAPRGNPLSPQYLADALAVEQRFLAEILTVPRDPLDVDAKLTYDIFKRQREAAIEGFTYPAELMPVDPFDGMPEQLARAAAETALNPQRTALDYENWQLRIDAYVGWTRQAMANMREGARRGYTSPRVVIERMLPLLELLGEDTAGNIFYSPVRSMPESMKDPQRSTVSLSYSRAVKEKLLPACRELHDFLQTEYLPRARLSIGLAALPLGPSWYISLARRSTGAQLTPNEIHAIGVAEVDRIRARMLAAPAPAPPAPPGDLLEAYRGLKEQTLAAMPVLFSALPQADFEIRPVVPNPTSRRLLYRAAAPGGRSSAILYVDTGPPAAAGPDIADFLRQAVPGRHLQSAFQQARTDLPKFRRFGSEPAFVDGWALYAASLGEELGLYRDDGAKRQALAGQLNCAAALVVDTGIHAMDWTRAQAAAYLRAQLAVDEADALLMTDRFTALPGDALACTIGELKFRALRERSQQVLGTRFDIREFHAEILKDGAMPLDILEAKMQRWMEAQH